MSEQVTAAMARIVTQHPDATEASLRVELADRVVTNRWSPQEATVEHLGQALTLPSLRVPRDSNLRIRRFTRGSWMLGVAKEVGPPRWSWPRLGVSLNRRRLSGVVGWNFTAYHLFLSWREEAAT